MADDAQPDSSPQARSVPPEFAERMRQRRPGYDRIYELILKYEDIPPEDRAKMSEGEVARSFVTPMFEALGWEVWPFMTEGRNEAPEGILDLVHRELHIPVEIKKFEDSLGGYTIQSAERWGVLTNFETIYIFYFRKPDRDEVLLQTSPQLYITDGNDRHDVLVAEIFYERLVKPSLQSIEGSSIESGEIFGTPSVTQQPSSQRIKASGIESGEAFGTPSVTQQLSKEPQINGQSPSDPQANAQTVGLTEEVTALKIPAPGFDSPVGNEEERSGDSVWPERWLETLSYLSPLPDASRNFSPGVRLVPQQTTPATYEVYAPANGKIVFARLADEGWFGTIIIESALPDQTRVFSRISQLTEIAVNSNEQVYRGQMIGRIDLGQPDKYLRYEIARSDILLTEPFHWVVNDRRVITEHYFNPTEFTQANRSKRFAQVNVTPEPVTLTASTHAPNVIITSELTSDILPGLGSYGEPDGPRQRVEEIVAGLSFGGGNAPARTITALVADSNGQPLLLLAGGTFPPRTEVIQPAAAHGGQRQDKIGVVEREIFNERCLGAVARLDGERPFLSVLPDGHPIMGLTVPRAGMLVCKFGAGSAYTQSTIARVNARVDFVDDYQRSLHLREAFYVGGPDFSQPGDVGALIVTVDLPHQAVGVIVGHSEDRAVCLPIQPILDQLNVRMITRRERRVLRATERIPATTDLIGGEDRLGFSHYVEAFVRLIEDTTPPLTIGIYGAWGSGKSFLMDKIARRLKPEGRIKEVEKLNFWQKVFRLKTQIPVIWFEAWDYNASDKLWAGLVERIFLGIENSGLGWYGQLQINLKRNLERQWRIFRAKLLPYTLLAIVIGALVLGFIFNNQAAWAIALGSSTGIVLLLRLLYDLFGLFSTSASQRIIDLFATPDYKADIGFMGRIRQDLEEFAKSLPNGMKVVVFIDDLDRCDPRKAVEVLEAVKLLLDFDRFIVFIALDARIITQAIEEYYGKVLTEAQITGYEYLDKIVQIPFSIPEPLPNELRSYLGSLVGLAQEEIPLLEATPSANAQRPSVSLQSAEGVSGMERAPLSGSTPGDGTARAAQQEQGEAATSPVALASSTEAGRTPREEQASSTAPRSETETYEATFEVNFIPTERQAFLDFYGFLDPNPRRVKRLVNIYRLVRALIIRFC